MDFLKCIRECDMRLFCYRAKCGDSFHLQYVGKSGKHRNIFLDMGYSKTYSAILKSVISKIVVASEQIDALFLSHIHDDHIGGASKFVRDIQSDSALNNVVKRWIYNAPRKYVVEQAYDENNGVLCGIVSSDKVYEHILSNNPKNLGDIIEGQSFVIDGMKVTIISPEVDKLNQLREKYSNHRPLCKSEIDKASVEAGSVMDDYFIPLQKFNLDYFQEDTSVENASSIAAVFEYDDKRILWLSDSVPSVVMKSLFMLGFSETNKMYCDAVLLSHHGSAANNSLALLRMIQADKYIISADGMNGHCLPNKETIARIVSASSNLPVTLYFNYEDGRLIKMFKSDAQEDVKSRIDVHYLKDMEAIEF